MNELVLLDRESIYNELESLRNHNSGFLCDWFNSVTKQLTNKLLSAVSKTSLVDSCRTISENYKFWNKLRTYTTKGLKGRNRRTRQPVQNFKMVAEKACRTNYHLERLLTETMEMFYRNGDHDFGDFLFVRDVLIEVGAYDYDCAFVANDKVFQGFVEARVAERCANNYRTPLGKAFEDELTEFFALWKTFSRTTSEYQCGADISHSVVKHRTGDLFEIVAHYPESKRVALEIGECVAQDRGLLLKIAESLNGELAQRLLHQGAPTTSILNAYISTIMCLNDIDGSGFLVRIVCDPIREHLRRRKGITNFVVSALTENILLDNVISTDSGGILDEVTGEIDTRDWREWGPRPVFNHQIERDLGMGSSDLLSLLTSIYGSKDSLLKEYREVLALKIISSRGFDHERELRALKILRNRFNDHSLHKAQVMFYDLGQSQQIFGAAKSVSAPGELEGCLMSAVVISDQFWPEQNVELFSLPPDWEAQLRRYERMFALSKSNRVLRWMPNLGLMTLEVERGGQVHSITTSPALAAIFRCFVDSEEIEYSRLASILQFDDPRALRSRVDHWISLGVIVRFERDGVELLKIGQLSSYELVLDSNAGQLEEAEDEVICGGSHLNSLFERFWPQALRMLRMMPSVTAQKIYSALRLFTHTSGIVTSAFTVEDVIGFVQTRIEMGEVLCEDNTYSFL